MRAFSWATNLVTLLPAIPPTVATAIDPNVAIAPPQMALGRLYNPSEGPDLFVRSSSPPGSVEAGRQRVTHLQAGTAQSGLYVRF